jgi:hypothetical protein
MHVMSQEARHSRRWSGLSPPQHTRAAAAGGLLSHQPAAGGGAWAETHRELLKSAIAHSFFFVPQPPLFFSITSDMAEARHFFSQAFPSISTGVYSYPVESATEVAFGEARKFLDTKEAKEACLVQVAIPTVRRMSLNVCVHLAQFERVIFVVFSAEDEAVYW